MGNWKVIVNGSTQDLDTNYNFKVQQMLGSGMPTLNNISTSFGLLDGALFQRTRVDVRSMTLVGYINGGSSVAELHSKRSDLIDVLKPDRSASIQPVVLQYTGGASTLQASTFLESGLELNNISVNDELNMALRFISYDPYWEKTTSTSAALTTQASFTANYVAQRAASGGWHNMANGLNGQAYALATTSNGASLWAGGAFTTAGGATACRIARWTGSSWAAASTGMNAGHVQTLAIAPDDSVWAGGVDFTTAGGTTVNRIARWNGSTWVAASTGMNDTVNSIVIGRDGSVYAGGGLYNGRRNGSRKASPVER